MYDASKDVNEPEKRENKPRKSESPRYGSGPRKKPDPHGVISIYG